MRQSLDKQWCLSRRRNPCVCGNIEEVSGEGFSAHVRVPTTFDGCALMKEV